MTPGTPFNAQAIRDAVTPLLASRPADHTNALALVWTPQGLKGVFAVKGAAFGGAVAWQVDTSLLFDAQSHDLTGAAEVVVSW